MKISRATPRGWQRYSIDPAEATRIMEKAEPILAKGQVVEAAGWRGSDGRVRKIELAFENGATWTLKIDARGRQSVLERDIPAASGIPVTLSYRLGGSGQGRQA